MVVVTLGGYSEKPRCSCCSAVCVCFGLVIIYAEGLFLFLIRLHSVKVRVVCCDVIDFKGQHSSLVVIVVITYIAVG